MSIIYAFLYVWFKVFKIDILDDDLFAALAATDLLCIFIFLMFIFYKAFHL